MIDWQTYNIPQYPIFLRGIHHFELKAAFTNSHTSVLETMRLMLCGEMKVAFCENARNIHSLCGGGNHSSDYDCLACDDVLLFNTDT